MFTFVRTHLSSAPHMTVYNVYIIITCNGMQGLFRKMQP